MFEIYLRDKENCPGYQLTALFKIPIDIKKVISVVPILFFRLIKAGLDYFVNDR